jgi:vitamin B12 transporter
MIHARAALAAIGASLAVAPAFASSDEPLDRIIVTGARAPLSIGAIGSAVTVITRDDIERRQARYVADLLRQVPGFAVSQSGVAGSQTQVRVRGAEANHVLVLVDGTRANDPATGDEFRWEFLTTANIERIEIVRGPQSAIWGSDALAGVVNIITRSGGAEPSLDGYIETGAHDTLNNALNGTVQAGEWRLGASYERLSTDGGNIARSGTEDDRSDATTTALNASWDGRRDVSVRLSARSVDAYSQYDSVDYTITGLPADSDVALATTQQVAQLAVVAGSGDARVRHRIAARHFDTENRNLSNGVEDVSALSQRRTLSYQADVALGRDTLSIAVEHEVTDFKQRGPVDFGDPNQDREMDVTSVVLDYQGRLGSRLSWLASARFDDNSVFDDALTGRVSLAWSVTEQTRLMASAGSGRKNPTFAELYGYYPGQFVNNPDLEPEASVGMEVGLEQRLGDALQLQFVLFRQDLDNEINGFVFDPITFLATAENMSGKSKRSGAELSLRWDLGDAVMINANYTYLDASADEIREIRRPRHSGSLDVDYEFLAGRGRVTLGAAYGGTRSDTFFPPWPNPPETVALHSHWLVDLTARYRLSRSVDLFARVGNLLDTDYEQVYGYATPGRAAYAGVQLAFGR